MGEHRRPVRPEYNQHGDTASRYWAQLYDVFPGWQFVLYDPGGGTVLAEGHTIPVAWDGTDPGLGPGIEAAIAGGFALRAARGRPTTVCARAAKIPPRHRGRHLPGVLLQANPMSGSSTRPSAARRGDLARAQPPGCDAPALSPRP